MSEPKVCALCEGERGEAKVTISVFDFDGVVLDYGDFCLTCAREIMEHGPLVVPSEEEFRATHEDEEVSHGREI